MVILTRVFIHRCIVLLLLVTRFSIEISDSNFQLPDAQIFRSVGTGDDGVAAIASGLSDLEMMAIASMSCIQDMKLVHMKNVTIDCFAKILLACSSLRKVTLLLRLRTTLLSEVMRHIEDRGTRLRWMQKPD
ncbi:uncharacterized protein [Physcomitrium patens]|uniref:uncharacterized protein n=1 Tax=Physcomitrium patens TaxID=3218 RepID=UPI003CCE3A17